MGNQCCQPSNNVEFESMAQEAFLSDYVQSQWPEDNDLQSLLKLSSIYKNDLGKYPLKHKVYNRWFWGNWTNGRPIGEGILYSVIAKDTVYYEGEFEGQPSGRGRVVFNGGEWEYLGIVKNARADGQGKLINKKEGFQFEGEWKQSKPFKGKLTLQSNSDPNSKQKQIEGNIIVQINLSSGLSPSTIYYPDGKKYIGEIHKFRFIPDGQGTLHFPNKSVYTGDWSDGQMHGQGKFSWADGSRYEGQYQFGKKCGTGKFIYASGNQYQGHWLNGKQQGQGILYDKNRNQLRKGLWKNGQFVQK